MKIYQPNSHYFDDDTVLCVDVVGHDGNISALQFAGGKPAHSPTGYAWGYHGAGPAELARAILADHFDNAEIEPALYQAFKDDKIATIAQSDYVWMITGLDIAFWLGDRHAKA